MAYWEGHDDAEQLVRLLDAAAGGEEAALRRLVDEYEPHIRRVVRRMRRNRPALRDSDDFTQDVWASFFRRLRELTSLERPRDLRNYLRMMAKHKMIDHERRESAADRRLHRVSPLPVARPAPTLPPPLEAVQAEEWQRLLVGKTPEQLQVLQLWREARPFRAIATATGMHVRRVRRIFAAAVGAVRGPRRKPRKPR